MRLAEPLSLAEKYVCWKFSPCSLTPATESFASPMTYTALMRSPSMHRISLLHAGFHVAVGCATGETRTLSPYFAESHLIGVPSG